jgi:hypothetical protein
MFLHALPEDYYYFVILFLFFQCGEGGSYINTKYKGDNAILRTVENGSNK